LNIDYDRKLIVQVQMICPPFRELFSDYSSPCHVQFRSKAICLQKGVWLDLDWTWYGESRLKWWKKNILKR